MTIVVSDAPVDFTWVPDQGAKRSVKPRILQAKFGDGYSQDIADGINSTLETWELAFSRRNGTEIAAIDNFLLARKGVTAFKWGTPRGVILNFKCRQWDTDDSLPSDASLSCKFEQVP